MAEQAFKQQVQSVLGDGNLTPDRAAALEKMREQVGHPLPACAEAPRCLAPAVPASRVRRCARPRINRLLAGRCGCRAGCAAG